MSELRPVTRAYLCAVVLAACAGTAWVLARSESSATERLPLVLGCTAAMTAAQLFPLHFAPHLKLSLGTSVILATMLLLDPGRAALCVGVGTLLAHTARDGDWREVLFNCSQLALQPLAGGLLLQLAGWLPDAASFADPKNAPTLLLAAAVVYAINTLSVAGILALESGSSLLLLWWRMFVPGGAEYLLQVALGFLAAIVAVEYAWLLPLLLLPPSVGLYKVLERRIRHRRGVRAFPGAGAAAVAALQATDVGTWQWLPDTGEMQWSPEVCRLLGLDGKCSTPTYDAFRAAAPTEDRARVERAAREAIAAGGGYEVDHRVGLADGSERVVRERGEVAEPEGGGRPLVVGTVQDITERVQAEDRLREAESRYRTLVDHTPAVTYVRSPTQGDVLTFVSPQVESLLGYSPEECLDTPGFWAGRLHPEDRDRVRAEEAVGGEGGRPFGMEYRLVARDGSTVWVRDEVVPVRDGADRFGYLQGVLIDISERKAAEAEPEPRTAVDALTGLLDRAAFLDRVGGAIANTRPDGRRCAVLVLNLDRFRRLNEGVGQGVGDQLLAAVGERIRGEARPGDAVARLRADEFAVLLEGLRDDEEATAFAGRIAEALEASFDLGVYGRTVWVSAAIGIAIGASGQERAEGLVRDADAAMRRAKGMGGESGGRWELFDRGGGRRRARLEPEPELGPAVERGWLRLFYQPQVDLLSGELAGVAALPQWEHPARGLLGLDVGAQRRYASTLAEGAGLSVDIGRWALEEACGRAVLWQREGVAMPVAVKVEPMQLRHPGFAAAVSAALVRAGLAPDLLVLELAEGAVLGQAEEHAATLRRLRDLGVGIAIHGFGTGYSSLSYLRDLPVDVLKIDGRFVWGMGEGTQDLALVEAILGLGRTMGFRVIADGVESAEQLSRLIALGCGFAQGEYLSPPLPGEGEGALRIGASYRALLPPNDGENLLRFRPRRSG